MLIRNIHHLTPQCAMLEYYHAPLHVFFIIPYMMLDTYYIRLQTGCLLVNAEY